MTTLHIVHGSPLIDEFAGGTERYVHALANHTGDTVVAPNDNTSDTSKVESSPYPLWSVGIKHSRKPVFKDTWCNPRFEEGLQKVLDQTSPDLVHIHHMAHVGLTVTSLLRRADIPYFITLHDHHLLCVRGQMLNREMERCAGPSIQRCPSCISEHLAASQGLHKAASIAKLFGVRRIARQYFEKRAPSEAHTSKWLARDQAASAALSGASAILSPSNHLAKRFLDSGYKVTIQDLPLLTTIKGECAPEGSTTKFLFVGSLIPSKGPHVLLEAMKSLPDCKLDLWGPVLPYDGQPKWQKQITELMSATPNAQYHGTFSDEMRSSVYAGAHVLVVPSIWEENSPLIVREGVAAGLHIIGTQGGGVGEIDPCATLVAPNDPRALSEAMRRFTSTARQRRTDKSDWPIETHTQELAALYAIALRK